ncbi:hypothetical protein ACOSP7_017626 [Xanthoceras sorbifolium]
MVGVGGDDDDGIRRRLPSWMLGVAQQRPQKENKMKTLSTQQHKLTHSNLTNKNKSNKLGQKRKRKTVSDHEIDAELTEQDLLSIAKEYVESDELQSLDTVCESQNQLLTTISSEKDSKGSFAAPTSPTHQTTPSLLSASTIGDPAHDMLHLFLGPLLNKPLEKENKMDFSNKFSNLSQSDAGEEIVPHKTTKSSLKDKVAMLLD